MTINSRRRKAAAAAATASSPDDSDSDSDALQHGPAASAPPTPKRGKDEYQEGAITRIKLTNFLTYADVEFDVGPGLNAIIGANGSGKSSIICAIALGLGGSLSTLGRATKLGSFIRTGESSCLIELELKRRAGHNMVIQRRLVLDEDGASSHKHGVRENVFSVDGKQVTEAKVRQIVAGMNIQVDNLCQFLPQEKVPEFAKMNPKQLLEATQKAVGGEEMLDQQRSLIKEERTIAERQKHMEAEQARLAKLQEENAEREALVKRAAEQEERQRKIRVLKNKRNWVAYEDSRAEYEECQQKKKDLEREIQALLTNIAPLEDVLKQRQMEFEEATSTHAKAIKPLKVKVTAAHKLSRAMTENGESVEEMSDQLRRTTRALSKSEKKLSEEKARLKEATSELEALANDAQEDLSPLLRTAKLEVAKRRSQVADLKSAHREKESDLKRAKNALQTQERVVGRLNDQSRAKSALLFKQNPPLRAACEWLHHNREKAFKYNVFTPLVLHMNIPDEAVAKMVEQLVSNRDLMAFLVEDGGDQEMLINELREKKKFKINVLQTPEQTQFSCPYNRQELRDLGFDGVLVDAVTAPPEVMSVLCAKYHLHEIPYCRSGTPDVAPLKKRYPNLRAAFDREAQYRFNQSRFGSAYNYIQRMPLREPRMIRGGVDPLRLVEAKTLVSEAQDKVKALEREVEDAAAPLLKANQKLKDFERQVEDIRNQINMRSRLQSRIKHIQDRLDGIQKMKKEQEDQLFADRNTLKETAQKMPAIAAKQAQAISEVTEMLKATVTAHINVEQAKQRVGAAKQALASAKHGSEDLSMKLSAAKTQAKQKRKIAKELLEAARSANNGADLSEDQKKSFMALPATLESLDTEIYTLQGMVTSTGRVDADEIEKYRKVKKEIERLKHEVVALEATQREEEAAYVDKRDTWRTSVEKLVVDINEKFSQFFRQLGCLGEVGLHSEGTLEDYGIHIRVCFRDGEQLQALAAHHQSGGERSVSTMLYLMAMQTQTQCPFRVVDEINQGMDSRNERIVFQQVMAVCTGAGSSQYFLVTPKLLPDLQYSKDMRILCVYTGVGVPSHEKWNLTHFAAARRKLDVS